MLFLLRFKIRNAIVYIVEEILSMDENATRIKFFKTKGLSTAFYFPLTDDIIEENNEDILSKLTASSKTETDRTAASILHTILIL